MFLPFWLVGFGGFCGRSALDRSAGIRAGWFLLISDTGQGVSPLLSSAGAILSWRFYREGLLEGIAPLLVDNRLEFSSTEINRARAGHEKLLEGVLWERKVAGKICWQYNRRGIRRTKKAEIELEPA